MAGRASVIRRTAAASAVERHEAGHESGEEHLAGPQASGSDASVTAPLPEGVAPDLAVPVAANTTARVGFAPIVRVDTAQREVELCATSEAVDSFGTVFDYDASKDAFTRWLGNVREMHERRAVGRRVAVRCDDANRRIYVRVRISRGAEDTWEKVLDGTLRGASIGASNVVWTRQVRGGRGQARQVQVATRYDLVELSLVDNPSNPDALGITLVRDALPDAALLDDLSPNTGHTATLSREEEPAERDDLAAKLTTTELDDLVARGLLCRLPRQDAPQARKPAGADVPGEEQRARGPFSPNADGYPDVGVPERAEERPTSMLGAGPEGNARERFHAAARAILSGCGCPLCVAAHAALGADRAESASPHAARTAGVSDTTREGERESALARALAAGLGASVARLDQVDASVRGLAATVESAITAAVRESAERTASLTGELRRRLETLEAQPLPGGPALRVAEKTHPLLSPGSGMGGVGEPGPSEQFRALESLAGRLTDPQAQIAVAAEMIRLQQGT